MKYAGWTIALVARILLCHAGQRGAREQRASNGRLYLTAIIQLRLRRAEYILLQHY